MEKNSGQKMDGNSPMERKKKIPCEWKKILDKKWMAKIAQWRERKLVRVSAKKILDENGWK